MPRVTDRFQSWSFSRFLDYDHCPAAAAYKHLHKVQTKQMAERDAKIASGEIESPMQRGIEIADKAAKYLKKSTRNLPTELAPLAAQYKVLRGRDNLSVEEMWGFTIEWKPCDPMDWNRCWLRVKIDVSYLETLKKFDMLHIIDNKSGRFRDDKNEEYQMQLSLYGVAGLARMPTIAAATAQLYYSDLGIVYPDHSPLIYKREALEQMKKTWEKRIKPMFADRKFAPKPSYKCQYCDFSKRKGGPCRY